MPVRERANIVCTECHSRKIKCDLQTTLESSCKNCRRSQQLCTPRYGVRRRRADARLQESISRSQLGPGPELPFPTPSASLQSVAEPESVGNQVAPFTRQSNRLFSSCPRQLYGEQSELVSVQTSLASSSPMRDNLLKSIQADSLPRPSQLRAWTDAYMAHVFHHCPVVEQKDLSSTGGPTMLQKAICLLGSLMRHDSSGPKRADEMYEVLKMMIYMNYEQDRVQTLKAICIISVYSGRPSNSVGLDGPWHWIGVATRQMIQIGLYRESTYAGRPDAGCLRRIFWQLHNSDSFQSACWGRPPLLKRRDFDVKLPTLEDFEAPSVPSLAFIESTKLCLVLSTVSELHLERRPIQAEEVSSVETALRDWILHLPDDLRLFDENGGRKPYRRPASEVMIQYFVVIIFNEILQHMRNECTWRVSISSLIAASCAVSLYDDINCRDEAIFLPWNTGYYCLIVALPLIHYVPQSPSKEAARKTELGVLRTTMLEMRGRYGDSNMILRMMQGLEKSIERTTRQGGESSMMQEPCIRASELFPFPSTMCDNMDLLELACAPVEQYGVDYFAAVQNWPIDEEIFDFTLMDLFGLDNGDMDFSLVGESGGVAAGGQLLM